MATSPSLDRDLLSTVQMKCFNTGSNDLRGLKFKIDVIYFPFFDSEITAL